MSEIPVKNREKEYLHVRIALKVNEDVFLFLDEVTL